MKVCTACKVEKLEEAFCKSRVSKDGLKYWCRECCQKRHVERYKGRYAGRYRKQNNIATKRWAKANPEKRLNAALLREFGITVEQYQTMLNNQGGVCAICKEKDSTDRRLAVDHVAGSNPPLVRGLLCFTCNTSIGKFKHSINLLQNAINYLNNGSP